MPAIKKRDIISEKYRNELEEAKSAGDMEVEPEGDVPSLDAPSSAPPAKAPPVKRKGYGANLLKSLDSEVLVEKRKRVLAPTEFRLDSWLDENLEKSTDGSLSVVKLYQLYTNTCQQEGTSNVAEIDDFRRALRKKFGKEFGVKESSVFAGLLKKKKRPKTGVAAACATFGYKLNDIITESIKTTGNPRKGLRFNTIKKSIAAKYPALQIDMKPGVLKRSLILMMNSAKVELVAGIGFAGNYRLPGPPDKEELPKPKKAAVKKEEGGEANGDEAEGGESGDAKKEENGKDEDRDAEGEPKTEEDGNKEGEVVEEEKEKKEPKPPQKKKNWLKSIRHSDPQNVREVFPLALTYMADPKIASITSIKKYLNRYYALDDVEKRLKSCIEKGRNKGMWDNATGSGIYGSFQLLSESFNPEDTDSMEDMICAAIIACNEPKTVSVGGLKKYINEYHADFNIDAKPNKFKNALLKAEAIDEIRRISGCGASGSFQLADIWTPSPALLAWDEDEEDDDEMYGSKSDEVYVPRATKSGRKSVPSPKKPAATSSKAKAASGKKRTPPGKKKAKAAEKAKGKGKQRGRKAKYVEESEEEESEEESEEEEEVSDGYRPRGSTSRGGGRGAPAKASAAPKGKSKAAAKAGRGRPAKAQPPPKKGKAKTPQKKQQKVKEEPKPEKSSKSSVPPKKRGRPSKVEESASEEEDHFEVEYEAPKSNRGKATPPPPKKRKVYAAPPGGRGKRSPSKSYREDVSDADSDDDGSSSKAKTPAKRGRKSVSGGGDRGSKGGRSSRGARQSYKEDDYSDDGY